MWNEYAREKLAALDAEREARRLKAAVELRQERRQRTERSRPPVQQPFEGWSGILAELKAVVEHKASGNG
jgi:hypothetical protein